MKTNSSKGSLLVSNGLNQINSLYGDIVATGDETGVSLATIQPGAVTFAKQADISGGVLVGLRPGGAGAPEEITLGTGLSMVDNELRASGVAFDPDTIVTDGVSVLVDGYGNVVISP